MAVCNTANLNMLDCMSKGLNLSCVHSHALADGSERGLTCSCCQTTFFRALNITQSQYTTLHVCRLDNLLSVEFALLNVC